MKRKTAGFNRGLQSGRGMNPMQMNNPQAQMLFLMMQQLTQGNAFGNLMKSFGG